MYFLFFFVSLRSPGWEPLLKPKKSFSKVIFLFFFGLWSGPFMEVLSINSPDQICVKMFWKRKMVLGHVYGVLSIYLTCDRNSRLNWFHTQTHTHETKYLSVAIFDNFISKTKTNSAQNSFFQIIKFKLTTLVLSFLGLDRYHLITIYLLKLSKVS